MDEREEYNHAINKTTGVSLATNLGLTLLKLIFGFMTHSLSLISDGLHSLSDILTDLIVWLGAKLGNKPADGSHHFGHGKFETFAEIILSFFIIGPAASIVWYALTSIYNQETSHFHWSVVLIALLSVIIKEALYRWSRNIAASVNSQVLLVNAWHHRTDALSSLIVVFGTVFIYFEVPYADSITGIIIGLLISVTGIKFLKRGLLELSESTPGKDIEKTVYSILEQTKTVLSFHQVRIRKLGSHLLMDMHIMVDEDLNIKEAHDIATEVELKIKNKIGYNTTNVLIHIEPFTHDHEDL